MAVFGIDLGNLVCYTFAQRRNKSRIYCNTTHDRQCFVSQELLTFYFQTQQNSTVSIARRKGIDVIINEVSKRETATYISFGTDKEGRMIGEKVHTHHYPIQC